MRDKDKVYYGKIILAIITGIVCGILNGIFNPPFEGKYGAILGICMLFATYPITVYGLAIDLDAVGGRRSAFTSGLLQFFFLWIVVWTLTFSIIRI
ncbi:MAG: hypothetical protein ACFFA1_03560 [Promethearchaeota archaeon]